MADTEQQIIQQKIQKVRDEAIDFLEGRLAQYPVRARVKKLETLKTKPVSVAWLEAAVLVRIAGRIKPARTLGMMNSLSKIQKANGQDEAFAAFAARVNGYLHPLRLTAHGYQDLCFTEENNRLALDHIGDLIRQFHDMEYQVFLNSGTLLGVVRDGRLIEHDDDVDLAILLKSETVQDAATEWVVMRAVLQKLGLIDEAGIGTNEMYKLTPRGQIQVDLFPAWIEKNRLFIYPHTNGEVGADALLPVKTCAVTGHPIPADAPAILELNYGTGWQTPDPFFVFPWLKQKPLFQEFIDAVEARLGGMAAQ